MLWFAWLSYIVDLFGVSFRVVLTCVFGVLVRMRLGLGCGVWLFGWVWVAGFGCDLLYLGLVICCVVFWFVLVGLLLTAGVCNVCLFVGVWFCGLCFTVLFCWFWCAVVCVCYKCLNSGLVVNSVVMVALLVARIAGFVFVLVRCVWRLVGVRFNMFDCLFLFVLL